MILFLQGDSQVLEYAVVVVTPEALRDVFQNIVQPPTHFQSQLDQSNTQETKKLTKTETSFGYSSSMCF
mgnify:CR=1 FL=1